MAQSADRRLSHQWNNNSAAVIVKLRGLHDHNEWDGIPMPSGIPMHVELGH
jgi:hypothetical protein